MSEQAFFPIANDAELALLAALDDPAQIPAFLLALADAQVQVPVIELPDAEGRVALPTIESRGETFVSVYTSEAAVLRAGREGEPRIAVAGRDLAGFWPARANLAINTGAGVDIALPAAAVQALSQDPDGVANTEIPAGTRVTVGPPETEPAELLARLSLTAAQWPAFRALHLALVEFDDSDDPAQLLIGVEVDPAADDLDAALRELALAAGEEAALLPLRRDAEDPINRFMRRQDRPFYAAAG